jgi:hypothetical protein
MAYWAQLDSDNKVIQVTVGDDNTPDKGYQWLLDNLGGRWVETFENNYAGIGWTYLDGLGFHTPQPYESWTLNGITWQSPTPKPEGDYYWSEEKLNWILYVEDQA